MQQFAELIEQLDQTTKTSKKTSLLAEYFATAPEKDAIWALALFSHRRPKRAINTRLLRLWVAEACQIPDWLFEETYHIVGDLAETIAKLTDTRFPKISKSRPLHAYIYDLQAIVQADDREKHDYFFAVLSELDLKEKFIFIKLLTGGFRIGVSQNIAYQAIANAHQLETAQIAQAFAGHWNPNEVSISTQLAAVYSGERQHTTPYPFYLAHPLSFTEEAFAQQWQAYQYEWKWDGIRAQIVYRAGEVNIWSRGEELVTAQFPELIAPARHLPPGTVLDGEIMAFKEGAPLPFADLQKRIGRKTLSKKILQEVPVCFKAYDLLECYGSDIRERELRVRRRQLEALLHNQQHAPHLQLSQVLKVDTFEELKALQADARSYSAEGLMMKPHNGSYAVGRKAGGWLKWKVAPLSIDAVMVYAQRGHGRRANLYSDYTFAVWRGNELVPFAKAYSGLTDQEMALVDQFVKKNTLERFGPVRTVKPELVFELAFEGIQPSSRHKSGIAVRFPRIARIRYDKKAEEANSLSDLQALLKIYG
jgi:DNA ligase 1